MVGMNSEIIQEIEINDRYKLVPLKTIENDNIDDLFRQGIGVYICNFPDEQWYTFHKFKRNRNYSIEKKTKFYKLMNEGSLILSPTKDSLITEATKTIRIGQIMHFGSRFNSRLAQLSMLIKIILYLIRTRKTFDYCLIYNFYPVEIIAAGFAKYILRKRIIMDFEDDYLLQSKKKFYKYYFSKVCGIPDQVICINRNMRKYFSNKEVYVFNGFINLPFLENNKFTLRNGMKFLYSGTLDNIRGVDLIPEIVKRLRNDITNFKIFITGQGPLEKFVKQFNFSEVFYLGFLQQSDFSKILMEVDAFLVLQKPDHKFSLGSFPSKIEFYSQYEKPIYKVELLGYAPI